MATAIGIWKAAVVWGLALAYYETIPSTNTKVRHFDTLIVLGTPCAEDGTTSPEGRERVLEGVREFRVGVASHIIMTGGAAHNQFVEADCMKRLAVSEGVPDDAVVEEGQAKDTIQNIWFSHALMDAHGWRSAEVVSSPSHLPRTALILEHYTFAWRTQAARWPKEYTEAQIAGKYAGEMRNCWRIRQKGFGKSPWLPHG